MFEAIDKFRNHDGHISMDRVESNLILFQDVYHLMATVKSRPLIKIRSTWNADGVKNQPNIIPLLADSNNPELFFRPTWPFVLPFFWGTFRPSASFPVPFIPLTGILEHIFPTSSLQFIQTFLWNLFLIHFQRWEHQLEMNCVALTFWPASFSVCYSVIDVKRAVKVALKTGWKVVEDVDHHLLCFFPSLSSDVSSLFGFCWFPTPFPTSFPGSFQPVQFAIPPPSNAKLIISFFEITVK